jgi:hypothetical protein
MVSPEKTRDCHSLDKYRNLRKVVDQTNARLADAGVRKNEGIPMTDVDDVSLVGLGFLQAIHGGLDGLGDKRRIYGDDGLSVDIADDDDDINRF